MGLRYGAFLFNLGLQPWKDFYKFDRPTEPSTARPPNDGLRKKASTPLKPATVSRTPTGGALA